MDVAFVVLTLFTVPFWLLLIAAPHRMETVRAVHAMWVFVAFAVVHVAMLGLGGTSEGNLFTLEGYKELQSTDAAILAGWVHYLSLDLFAGAWIARDAQRLDLPRSRLVISLLLTFMFAPLGLAIYLLMRNRKTGKTSLFESPSPV